MRDLIIPYGLGLYFGIGLAGCFLLRRKDISFNQWFWGGGSGWLLEPEQYFNPRCKNWARWWVGAFLPFTYLLFSLAA